MPNKIKKVALISGVSGQDGAYLAHFLLSKDYIVYGTSRDASTNSFFNLTKLGILQKVKLLSMDPTDFISVLNVFNKVNPDEIYSLSSQSSVGLSFDQPTETFQSIVYSTLNFLEVCRISTKNVKFYNAGSSEIFGNDIAEPTSEVSVFHPASPYAVAKLSAYLLVINYRNSYNLHASTGILFNHESPLRPDRFVTKKVISAARNIANGNQKELLLGRLDIVRDWGWAPDFVKAMWLILQEQTPSDYVIGTGIGHSLEYFVDLAFKHYNIDYKNHVRFDDKLLRPSENLYSIANPSKAQKNLGWYSTKSLEEIVTALSNEQLF